MNDQVKRTIALGNGPWLAIDAGTPRGRNLAYWGATLAGELDARGYRRAGELARQATLGLVQRAAEAVH